MAYCSEKNIETTRKDIIAVIETEDFDKVDWIKYKDQVIERKDDIEFLYSKRFYKSIMKKIEGKQSFFSKIFKGGKYGRK